MHNQNIAIGQVCQKIFGAPSKGGNALTFNTLCKILRERKAQIWAALFQTLYAFMFQNRLQTAPNRFNFWQFGQDVP